MHRIQRSQLRYCPEVSLILLSKRVSVKDPVYPVQLYGESGMFPRSVLTNKAGSSKCWAD